ncbi:MAG: DUF4166 domain-containing protein [Microbacteriaceae bacterium]|nr:DUF4166 domain-containing protein [Microbacteriaceae bacterium]
MSVSVYQQVLGDDFYKLTPQLQRYFGMPYAGSHGRGTGTYEVAGSELHWLRPILRLFGSRNILFAERERDVPFTVLNRPDGDILRATRLFHFGEVSSSPGSGDRLSSAAARRQASRRAKMTTRTMVDEMRVIDGVLHDYLGTNKELEVTFDIAVSEDKLTMTSSGSWLRLSLGKRLFRFKLPTVLGARVVLTERWELDHQRVSVTLTNPILGEIFTYRGTFTYDWVRDEVIHSRNSETGR